MEKQTIKRIDLSQVKKGDRFIRMLGGEFAHEVIVGDIDDTYIWVGSDDGAVQASKEVGWKFLRSTGTEVDEELSSDGINTTISYLKNK